MTWFAAKMLNSKFYGFCDSSQQTKLSELFACTSVKELLSSPLVTKFKWVVDARESARLAQTFFFLLIFFFRNKKYFMRMSEGAFQLLMQFLQVIWKLCC